MDSPKKSSVWSKRSDTTKKQSENASFLRNYAKYFRGNLKTSKNENFPRSSDSSPLTLQEDQVNDSIKVPPIFKTRSNNKSDKDSIIPPQDSLGDDGLNMFALCHLYSLPPIPESLVQEKAVYLPPLEGSKKTLILDLDETLVHCVTYPETECEVKLKIKESPSVLGINIRPFLHEFLEKASFLFEVIVFTASQPVYANAVLDYLDPKNSIFKHRLYRDQCILHGGIYIKDLRVLKNRHLEEMAIVDNSFFSFGFQIDNGIPIKSWYDDYSDTQLVMLSEYLDVLYHAVDVRKTNSSQFHLRKYYRKYIPNLDNFKKSDQYNVHIS